MCMFQKGTVVSVLLTNVFLAPHIVPGTWYLLIKYLLNGKVPEHGRHTHAPCSGAALHLGQGGDDQCARFLAVRE